MTTPTTRRTMNNIETLRSDRTCDGPAVWADDTIEENSQSQAESGGRARFFLRLSGKVLSVDYYQATIVASRSLHRSLD